MYPSSIKNNILFGEKYNKARYDEVLRICGLDYDLRYLQNGDETIVSEGGMNLSKGQQARINLARCVYKESDMYLLDDPLTALDATVQDYIFTECICKFLKSKIVLFISQNDKHMKVADNVFTLSQGKLINESKPTVTTEEKEAVIKTISSDLIEKKILEKAAIAESDNPYTNDNLFHETHESGNIKLEVYKSYIKYGGGYIFFGAIMLLYTVSQGASLLTEKIFAKW